jgi:torulene dioxygenase
MTIAAVQPASKAPYNNYWVGLEDLKYVPPYLRDVQDTPNGMICATKGTWPTWLEGSFMR